MRDYREFQQLAVTGWIDLLSARTACNSCKLKSLAESNLYCRSTYASISSIHYRWSFALLVNASMLWVSEIKKDSMEWFILGPYLTYLRKTQFTCRILETADSRPSLSLMSKFDDSPFLYTYTDGVISYRGVQRNRCWDVTVKRLHVLCKTLIIQTYTTHNKFIPTPPFEAKIRYLIIASSTLCARWGVQSNKCWEIAMENYLLPLK